MYERFRFYRTWKKSKRGKPPVLPLQGTAPSVVVPKVGQRALPWVKTQRDDIDLDLITDERSLHRKYRKAYFAVNRLKAYFERNLPELKYNKCLGWGGNGLAAAFDIIDVDGQKERAVVVKMLFLDDPKWLIQEVGNCECPLLEHCKTLYSRERMLKNLYSNGKLSSFVVVDSPYYCSCQRWKLIVNVGLRRFGAHRAAFIPR